MYLVLLLLFSTASHIFPELPPCEDTYIIQIPDHVDLAQSDSITVTLNENNLGSGNILHVDFADSLTLHDTHGRSDVLLTTSNQNMSYAQGETGSRSVILSCPDLPAGEWNGSLPFTISIENTVPSNVLVSGSELNPLLNIYDIDRLYFSVDYPFSSADIDVSAAADQSLMLHIEGNIATIYSSNNGSIIANENMSAAFAGLASLSNVYNIDLLDMSICKDISYLFRNDANLTSIGGISSLDVSAVENMSGVFYSNSKLTTLDLSAWDTAECENFSQLFYHCSRLRNTGDLSSWDLDNCLDLSQMFSGCERLTTIGNVSSWNTENVMSMSGMFEMCKKLTSIGNISGWDVSEVNSFSRMFYAAKDIGCLNYLSSWNVSDECQDLSLMFADCADAFNTEVDLHGWDVSGVTDMSGMFYNCFSLQRLDISGWDTSSLIRAASMFECNDVSRSSSLQTITGIADLNTTALEDIQRMFYTCTEFNADLSRWNTVSLQDISRAFYGCWKLEINRLKDWNVSSLINMDEAFGYDAGADVYSDPPGWYH